MPDAFTISAESADDGSFRRQESRFRNWVDAGGRPFPPVAGRYHLYVCSRLPLGASDDDRPRADGAQEAISISFVDPIRDSRGWAFTGATATTIPSTASAFLSEAYLRTDPAFDDRVTRPGAVGP